VDIVSTGAERGRKTAAEALPVHFADKWGIPEQ